MKPVPQDLTARRLAESMVLMCAALSDDIPGFTQRLRASADLGESAKLSRSGSHRRLTV
jgi:hypothetical protein